MRNVSLVPKDYNFVGNSYIWQDDAACAFWPSSMFELHDKESRIWKDFLDEADGDQGEAHKRLQDFNKANFEKAATVCASCPALDACLSSATEDDLTYTFRGGREPLKNKPAPWGRPKKTYESIGDCSKGHEGGLIRYPSGKTSCRACANLRYQVSKNGGPRERSAPEAEECLKGHKDWGYRKGKGGKLRRHCLTCARNSKRKYAGKMEA